MIAKSGRAGNDSVRVSIRAPTRAILVRAGPQEPRGAFPSKTVPRPIPAARARRTGGRFQSSQIDILPALARFPNSGLHRP
jgi:hypothetical protein